MTTELVHSMVEADFQWLPHPAAVRDNRMIAVKRHTSTIPAYEMDKISGPSYFCTKSVLCHNSIRNIERSENKTPCKLFDQQDVVDAGREQNPCVWRLVACRLQGKHLPPSLAHKNKYLSARINFGRG